MHVVALSPSAVCTSSSVASNVRAISPHASCASACPELKPSVSEQKGQGKSVVSTTWIPCSIRRPIQFREPQMRSLWLRGTLSSYLHLKDQGSSDPLLLGGGSSPAQPPPPRGLSHTSWAWVEALWGVPMSPHGRPAAALPGHGVQSRRQGPDCFCVLRTGQQSQPPSSQPDYSKAWEDYYKKQSE